MDDSRPNIAERELRRGLRLAVSATTHADYEREFILDVVAAANYDLASIVKCQNMPKLSEDLQLDLDVVEKLHHFALFEYSKLIGVKSGERFCVAPTVNYLKWHTKSSPLKGKASRPTTPRAAGQHPPSDAATPTSSKGHGAGMPSGDAERAAPATPIVERVRMELSSSTNARGEDEVHARLWVSREADVIFSPPKLHTDAHLAAVREKRRHKLEAELREDSRRAEEEKARNEMLMKKALLGPSYTARPGSASPGKLRHSINSGNSGYFDHGVRQRLAQKGPTFGVGERPTTPTPSPNKTPSPASIKAYFPASTERAQAREAFDAMMRKKEEEEALARRAEEERRAQEEAEAARAFRKTLKFKARPLPSFYAPKAKAGAEGKGKGNGVGKGEGKGKGQAPPHANGRAKQNGKVLKVDINYEGAG